MHKELERDRLYVTTDLLILTVRAGQLGILLARRSDPPFRGCWALPGRFVGLEECAEECARTLLTEMLPLEGVFLEQLYTFTDVDRDPRGRVLSAAYLAIVSWGRLEKLLEDPEAKMHCFELHLCDGNLELTGEDGTCLNTSELAFDHDRIIITGVQRLRGKIGYTEIGFHFLEDIRAFPMSELAGIFKAVLEKEIDESNFRRTIHNRYEETGRLVQTAREERRGRGRPAALYSLTDLSEGGKKDA